jgi:hypothetical protein
MTHRSRPWRPNGLQLDGIIRILETYARSPDHPHNVPPGSAMQSQVESHPDPCTRLERTMCHSRVTKAHHPVEYPLCACFEVQDEAPFRSRPCSSIRFLVDEVRVVHHDCANVQGIRRYGNETRGRSGLTDAVPRARTKPEPDIKMISSLTTISRRHRRAPYDISQSRTTQSRSVFPQKAPPTRCWVAS